MVEDVPSDFSRDERLAIGHTFWEEVGHLKFKYNAFDIWSNHNEGTIYIIKMIIMIIDVISKGKWIILISGFSFS